MKTTRPCGELGVPVESSAVGRKGREQEGRRRPLMRGWETPVFWLQLQAECLRLVLCGRVWRPGSLPFLSGGLPHPCTEDFPSRSLCVSSCPKQEELR